MKTKILKTSLAICLILSSSFLMAQDNEVSTVFGNNNYQNGGYGGITVSYSQIANKDAILVGAQGAWILNHGIGIGLAGFGFANELDYNMQNDTRYVLSGGYGGLLIEPIILPKFPVHIAFPIVIGVGGIAYTDTEKWLYETSENWYVDDADAFVVIEPGMEIEMNLVSFMRLSLGVKYRYTSNVRLDNFDSQKYEFETDLLHGFTYGISLKFGKF